MKPTNVYSVAFEIRGTVLKYFCSLAFIVLAASGIAAGQIAPQTAWSGVLRNAAGAPIVDAQVKLSSGSLKAEG